MTLERTLVKHKVRGILLINGSHHQHHGASFYAPKERHWEVGVWGMGIGAW